MSDKLLIEIDIVNGDAVDVIHALVFLANEISECSTIEITDTPIWRERAHNAYQLKWCFTEDAFSSWQLSIGVDLALKINEALRVAQSALDEKTTKRRNDTSNVALEAIKKAQEELFSFINKAEPELSNLIAE